MKQYSLFTNVSILSALLLLSACAPRISISTLPPSPTAVSGLTEPPPVESAASPEPSASAVSLVVAFVKDGDIHLWDDATQQSRTLIRAGDVVNITMSDDAQLLAFTRRAWVGSEMEGYEQLSLWAINRDGTDPREVIPAEFLRQRLNLSERESSNFHQLGWIPGTHQVLFSITQYIVQAEGMSHAIPHGAYIVNLDSGSVTTLAEPPENLRLIPSPDGAQMALLSPTSLSFIKSDGSNRHSDVLTYPEAGLTGPLFPTGVWTEDSHAFVLTGSFEKVPRGMLNFTFWRVPVDSSTPVSLATVLESDPNSVTYSPDGNYAAYVTATDGQPPEIAGWSIKRFEVEAGPLAIPYYGKEAWMANLHWSPSGQAYSIQDHDLAPLCPDATQDTQRCGEALRLGIDSNVITALQWMDRNRFLVAGIEPNMLVLGNVDGTFVPVATWEEYESVSWSAVMAR